MLSLGFLNFNIDTFKSVSILQLSNAKLISLKSPVSKIWCGHSSQFQVETTCLKYQFKMNGIFNDFLSGSEKPSAGK